MKSISIDAKQSILIAVLPIMTTLLFRINDNSGLSIILIYPLSTVISIFVGAILSISRRRWCFVMSSFFGAIGIPIILYIIGVILKNRV